MQDQNVVRSLYFIVYMYFIKICWLVLVTKHHAHFNCFVVSGFSMHELYRYVKTRTFKLL